MDTDIHPMNDYDLAAYWKSRDVDSYPFLTFFFFGQDKLGQDVFLIGSPGPLRRLLAMQYLVRIPCML